MDQIKNMRVDINSFSILLTMYNVKVSLVLVIFSSIVDRSWHLNKIAPVEKMQKNDENGYFWKP